MSKQVRWQIPFVSRLGTAYRVDIYDEGYTGTPVQLLDGTSPFTTDEDDSDDYFAPIRVQTGTLTVCTHDEDGNVLVTLDDILPANNISRPVRLVNVGTGAIEWQGFLSCEAYDQDYTSIPQHLQLPVISVLEAMDSVEVSQERVNGVTYAYWLVYKILGEIETQIGTIPQGIWSNVLYSQRDWRIFTRKINASVFFKEDKQSNNNNDQLIASGVSCKAALSMLATYMGWTVREIGTTVYFQRISDEIGMCKQTFYTFGNYFHAASYTEINQTAFNMKNLSWRGTDHKQSVEQGAKSVSVTASMEELGFKMELPGFPYGEMSADKVYEFYDNVTDDTETRFMHTFFSLVAEPYDNITFGYHACTMAWTNEGATLQTTYNGTRTKAQAMEDSFLWGVDKPIRQTSKTAGAFFVRHADRSAEGKYKNAPFEQGLYCCFLPQLTVGGGTGDYPMFSMRTEKRFNFTKGKIMLNIKFSRVIGLDYNTSVGRRFGTDKPDFMKTIGIAISIGGKYYDGLNSWTTTRNIIPISFQESEAEFDIIIPSNIEGQVKLELMAWSRGYDKVILLDGIIESIQLEYETETADVENDREENNYFQLLNANFRDEIKIDTQLASNMNNHPSPSLIMDNDTDAMTELEYTQGSGTVFRRPEVDLLNRLAEYYGAARQRLELEVAHPTAAPLPLLRLNGIIPDTRKYLPLAESRDWQEETCTLTCFETPNNE